MRASVSVLVLLQPAARTAASAIADSFRVLFIGIPFWWADRYRLFPATGNQHPSRCQSLLDAKRTACKPVDSCGRGWFCRRAAEAVRSGYLMRAGGEKFQSLGASCVGGEGGPLRASGGFRAQARFAIGGRCTVAPIARRAG